MTNTVKHVTKHLVPGLKMPRRIKTSVFRLKPSLDDPSKVIWRPNRIADGEWPCLMVFKLDFGKLTLLHKIDIGSHILTVLGLEVANDRLYYAAI